MKLSDSFDRLDKLRVRIGGKLTSTEFGESLDPLQKIVVQLENEGITVEREDIEKVGPFLTYKGQVLAILYIFNSNDCKSDIESEFPQQRAPRFHFTWCRTLDNMEKTGRFARYVLSRSKQSLFDIEAKERDPEQIALYGERHLLKGIKLAPCQNCLDELSYHDFSLRQSKDARVKSVTNFSLQNYLDENDGTFNVMKFTPEHTSKTMYQGGYTKDFPKISTDLRRKADWKCSKCEVDMKLMKKGLHVHHVNGVKGDNSEKNLRVLCALCHKNIDRFHQNMFVSSEIEGHILSYRQYLLTKWVGMVDLCAVDTH